MGISNRDYIRDTPQPNYSFGGTPSGLWAIKYLIIANVAVFLLQNMSPQVTNWLSLSLTDLKSFQVWRLVTYGFCHDVSGLTHLFFNMIVLWMFGRMVESIYGSKEFLSFYLVGVVISGLCHVGMQLGQGIPAGVVGASGGVMSVVFLTAMHFPRMKVYLMLIIPVPLGVLAVGYAFFDLVGTFSPTGSNVAHAAHLGGAAFGVAYRYYNWRVFPTISRLFSPMSFRLPKRKSKVRLYTPPKKEMDDQVDAILEKIHRSGEASLTDKERKILMDASRQQRDKQRP
jgi:membrane associated rhomboid family serine protease